ESLVQVQVGDVATELPRLAQADQRIEIRPVDVHLAARSMDLVADLADVLLEHAVGGRVGDHDAGDLWAVLLQLGVQVIQQDGAVFGGLHGHDLQASQRGGSGVGAVRGGGDQHL